MATLLGRQISLPMVGLPRTVALDVETVSIESKTGERLTMDTGLLLPPGVLLDGTPFSHGRLSEGKLRRELDRLLTVDGRNR